tara:strand:- start:3594 stop:4094 length:501 start_codon:yes stop_codon:yes gene_type:complete
MLLSSYHNYAFIGLGSNLSSQIGSPKDNVLKAIEYLKKLSDEPVQISTLLTSKPLDCPPGSPDFINAVLALLPRQHETALDFLQHLQQIESSIGRTRSGVKNEARIIDLDLLIYRDEVCSTEKLVLPHPELLFRSFVLEPLQEILDQEEFTRLKKFAKKNSARERS